MFQHKHVPRPTSLSSVGRSGAVYGQVTEGAVFATLTLQRAYLRSSRRSASPYPHAEQEKVYLSNKPVQTDALLPRSQSCSSALHNLPGSYQVKSEWTDHWLSKEAISSSSGNLPAQRAARHSPAEPPGRLPRWLTGRLQAGSSGAAAPLMLAAAVFKLCRQVWKG